MITILIVDDEKLERRGIRFLLKREEGEFQILEATNGKDALGVLCIFRKNCASVPEERSAIPLQTEQSSAG